MLPCFADAAETAVPIIPVEAASRDERLADAPEAARQWAKAAGFKAKAGEVLPVPDADGGLACVLFGLGPDTDPFVYGALPGALPAGTYALTRVSGDPTLAALGFALGTYRFDRYKASKSENDVLLVLPADVDGLDVSRLARAHFLARDLINTPASDMGPADLEAAAEVLERRFDGRLEVTAGETLLSANYPMIHAVGRASDRAPRLIDLRFGRADARKVTIVGKGVCFDTGGLNLKPGSAMALMKKDMGGAAAALALAQLLLDRGLDIRLRVLLSAVDNSVAGNAFRPGDVLSSRKGLTVEIGNTDAEGRLVLADALADADDEEPELLVDFATLTGAARVALGPELPPFYTDDDELADAIAQAAVAVHDPLWRLPLWAPYDGWLDSKVADVNHISDGPFAGSITAALFLKRFVTQSPSYVHFDIYGWNAKPRPGRPVGGELQAVRALARVICHRFG